ncbi:MAG: serine/threonine protein kinase [Leptolyngbyaceae cyanobacterium HOT.MB2.61]|jgi:serine/threonine protein kinase|nr:serine/threonine protein kinase [Leptolyngbyaceae cyanobacterium HOT.MB2.61]
MIGQLLTGRYLILEKLGAGGFSETYLARDKYLPRHPLCVVKCLKLSSNSTISHESAQRLFETEASVLERLGQHHTQIPTLYAYCHEQEQPYLVQEYIDGENLGRWFARKQRLTSDAAIKLLLELLPVLDYLYSQRVIHRDIKPSNLIRRRQDSRLVLIDFGAACLLPEDESSTKPDSDDLSLAIGTPGYMPDEQHLGMSQLNSDLYALGMLVIHMLTGVHPREFKQDLISGEIDWHRFLDEKSVDPKLIEILDGLVRVKFSDRYQRPADVLTDLQTLTSAKRSWHLESISGWRTVVQQTFIPVAAALLLGVVGGQYIHAHGKHIRTLLTQFGKQFYQSEIRLTMVRDLPIQSGVKRMVITPDNRMLITAGADHILRLWSLPAGKALKSLHGHRATVTSLATSRDGKWLASGSEDGTIRVWDLDSGQSLLAFQGHQHPITAIAISPDQRSLVTGCKDGSLRRWDMQTGIRIQTLKIPDAEVTAVIYGSTADSLISASSDRQLQVWNLRSGQLHRTFAGHTDAIVGLQIADDHTLYSFGKDRGFAWDLKQEELALVFPEKSANSIAASLSHQNLVTVHDNGSIRIWTRKRGRLVPREAGTLGRNLDIALSPNHHYLVSLSSNQRLRVWQMNPVGLRSVTTQ